LTSHDSKNNPGTRSKHQTATRRRMPPSSSTPAVDAATRARRAFECAADDARANDLDAMFVARAIPTNLRDECGNTLLHVACVNDALECAKVIARRCVYASHPPERGYLTSQNADGETAGDAAAVGGAERCARWLGSLGVGCDDKAADRRSRSRGGRKSGEATPMRTSKTDEALVGSLQDALTRSGASGEDSARARGVLRAVLRLVAEKEALSDALEASEREILAAKGATEGERERERSAVVAALGLAERRAREMVKRSEDVVAEKEAMADALRETEDEYARGYAAGWRAALELSSRDYVRAQMELERGGAGEMASAKAATDGFSEIPLGVGANGGDATKNATAAPTLGERASNVFRETFTTVKKRVETIERAFGTKVSIDEPAPDRSELA